MKTYCATFLRLNSRGFREEAISNLDGETFNSKFANKKVKLKFYKEGDSIMVVWKSPVLIPEDSYYLDCGLMGEQNEVDGVVEKITGVADIKLTPTMDDPEGVQKVRSYYGRY